MQGIAALNPNMPQGGPQGGPPPASMSPDVTAALGKAFSTLDPQELTELRSLSDQLKTMPPEKLKVIDQVIEFINENQNKYDQAVQVLIAQKIVEPGDMPPEYNKAFFDILQGIVKDAMSKVAGSPAPMQGQQASDMGANTSVPQFAKGGIAGLAAMGRHEDTMLAHISPREAAILKAHGGSGTINPNTGLKEYSFFGDIGNFFKQAAGVVLPVALNFMFPGLGTIASGALGMGAAALLNGAKPGQALQSALMGGAVGGIYSGVQGALSGQGFMAGVQGAMPSGLQSVMTPTVAQGTSPAMTPKPNPGDIAGGGYGTGNVGGGNPAAPGIMSQATDWMSQHPYLTAAGALGAGAMLTGMGGGSNAAKGKAPTGPTQEQIEAARFAPGAFAVQTAPKVNVVPTYSPAYPSYSTGGITDARVGGHLEGPGTGTSDSIPAKLSDGEFVMTAKAVRGAGNGDRMKGAKRMYQMMHQYEKRA